MSHDREATELVPTGKKKFMAFIATSTLLYPGVLEGLAQRDVNMVWASQMIIIHNRREINTLCLEAKIA